MILLSLRRGEAVCRPANLSLNIPVVVTLSHPPTNDNDTEYGSNNQKKRNDNVVDRQIGSLAS